MSEPVADGQLDVRRVGGLEHLYDLVRAPAGHRLRGMSGHLMRSHASHLAINAEDLVAEAQAAERRRAALPDKRDKDALVCRGP